MVLAKLISIVARKKLQAKQLLTVSDLDSRLDVATDSFPATALQLARLMAKARASIDLGAYRASRQNTANMAALPELPEVRDSLYQQDLRRIEPMDRAEEFRMARRHEFLAGLVRGQLERIGVPASEAAEWVKQPAKQTAARLASRAIPRGVDLAWVVAMVEQLEELRRLYVEGALSIVLTTVNRYRGLGVDALDLIQEGNASLYQAIDGFDWRRDVRFRTYATFWVHQAVLKMLYNSSRTVRVPIWVQKILGKIRRAQDAGRREGRELTADEIATRIGVPATKVEWVLATRRYATSIDAELGGEDGATLAQTLPDESLLPVPDSVPVGDLSERLAEVMADLPERERRILRLRYGLDGGEPQTLGEIAVGLGITAERVRQLQNAAIGRIKRPAKMRQLQAFVE